MVWANSFNKNNQQPRKLTVNLFSKVYKLSLNQFPNGENECVVLLQEHNC